MSCIHLSQAEASGSPIGDEVFLLAIAEPLIPDLQLEFGDTIDGADLTLAWPLPVFIGAEAIGGIEIGLTALLEPQIHLGHKKAYRLLTGSRVYASRYNSKHVHYDPLDEVIPRTFIEGGYVVGEGNGYMAGGGLTYGFIFAAFSTSYRYMKLGDNTHHVITAELHLALPLFLL